VRHQCDNYNSSCCAQKDDVSSMVEIDNDIRTQRLNVDWSQEKVLRLQKSPPSSAPLMLRLKNHVLAYFRTNGKNYQDTDMQHLSDNLEADSNSPRTVTLDTLARDPDIHDTWKRIGRVPLWKLLKQFSGVMEQRQQSDGFWKVRILLGNESEDEVDLEAEKGCDLRKPYCESGRIPGNGTVCRGHATDIVSHITKEKDLS